MSISMKFSSRGAIFAGAIGLALAASSANAQDYGRYDNGAYSNDENIQVIAPRFDTNADGQRLNGPLEKISLSTNVSYDDLNLRTRRGARELKMRVRDAAQSTCARLAEAYPVEQAFGTNCYKTALQNAELRANSAIRDARDRRYED
jgi:UrcA family protein